VPLFHSHAAPAASLQADHWQLELHTCSLQSLHGSFAPGEQVPWPVQLPQAPHEPQVQPSVHVRVRFCVPQLPQPWLWDSLSPGTQVPPEQGDHEPHVH
jgi:hypothetical protein